MIVAAVCAAAALGLIYTVLSPYLVARVQHRPMTAAERDQLAWGGLAVFMALFLLALLLIGAHQ